MKNTHGQNSGFLTCHWREYSHPIAEKEFDHLKTQFIKNCVALYKLWVTIQDKTLKKLELSLTRAKNIDGLKTAINLSVEKQLMLAAPQFQGLTIPTDAQPSGSWDLCKEKNTLEKEERTKLLHSRVSPKLTKDASPDTDCQRKVESGYFIRNCHDKILSMSKCIQAWNNSKHSMDVK